MKIYLLNQSAVPCQGLWDAQSVTNGYAKYLANNPSFISAVGHDSTAELLSALLEVTIPVNRIQVQPEVGDWLLCFKLKKRAPEGKILSIDEMEQLGYEFFLMKMIATSVENFAVKCRINDSDSNVFKVLMSDDLKKQLDEIKEMTDMSRSGIFRRAISLYHLAKKRQQKGERLIIYCEKEGKESELIDF